jgi:hypothetical protein
MGPHPCSGRLEGDDPIGRMATMTDHPPQKKHGGDIRVNMRGINIAEAKAGAMATLSLLSEGERFCDECGERIDGLAVYFTRPRPDLRDGYELVAITCPPCAGYVGEDTP